MIRGFELVTREFELVTRVLPYHVNILTNISKIHEKLTYNQLYGYFDDIPSPSQCGFGKGYSTQHCLLVMLEKFKKYKYKSNEIGAPITDRSKAFDCTDHKLLVAKLFWYGLIFFYLSNRTHLVKINFRTVTI